MKPIRPLTPDPSSQINQSLQSISTADIDAFERRALSGTQLPADYRDFLLQRNGGSFLECIVPASPIGALIVVQFLSLSEDAAYSLPRSLENLRDYLPRDLLPFAEDPAGNCFVMAVSTERYGEILFWDHETRKVYPLAASFSAFLNSLERDP